MVIESAFADRDDVRMVADPRADEVREVKFWARPLGGGERVAPVRGVHAVVALV